MDITLTPVLIVEDAEMGGMISEEMGISSELAEFVGILLGDGSLNVYPSLKYSTYYRIKVSCHSDEQGYIDYLANLIKRLFGVTPKKSVRKEEKTTELLLFNKHIVERLVALGLITSPKRGRAVIPAMFLNPPLDLAVLRGYFDTDGSVVLAHNNGTLYPRLEMKICSSPMQRQFLDILDQHDFSYGSYAIGNGAVRIQLNGRKNLYQWFAVVGSNNPKHLHRANVADSSFF